MNHDFWDVTFLMAKSEVQPVTVSSSGCGTAKRLEGFRQRLTVTCGTWNFKTDSRFGMHGYHIHANISDIFAWSHSEKGKQKKQCIQGFSILRSLLNIQNWYS